MSKLGLVILLSFLSGRTLSQDYFVFIGSDHRQPFYVRIDSQVYSSSAEGHLLVAPLKDSAYILTIGFPGQTYPEKRYGISMSGKDQEFELRQQGDDNWRLYDELAKNWVTALEKESGVEPGLAGVKKDDAFSRMMAGVVHDTAVLYNTYSMEEALKDSSVGKGGAADSVVGVKDRAAADSLVGLKDRAAAAVSAVTLRADSLRADSRASGAAGVVKVSEKKSLRSVRLVYADRRDTIVVIIPRDADAAAESSRDHPVDTIRMAAVDMTRKAEVDTVRKAAKGIAFINSDCHNFATDYDVDRLRVKMLDAARDEDRIVVARKVFKTKCFYTLQIRALSEVFTSDAGKFRFFEAAWPFAADEHFGELSALLTDPAYVGKFKMMTGAQP
jgi:hypothetical protein